jgi:hypothetical protein
MNEFQKRAEKAITDALKKQGFQIENRVFENHEISFDVKGMEVIIMGSVEYPDAYNQLECWRDSLFRGLEFYKGINEDREINNFIRCLTYYLKHPEHKDKPSWEDWRSTLRWIKGNIFSITWMDDANELEGKK